MAHLNTHSEGGVFIVEFFDNTLLNQAEIESVGQEFFSIAGKSACSNIVVDLKNVDLLSSAMIGVFIRFKMRLRKNGSDLKLCNAKPELMEMLKLTKLDAVFDVHSSRDDAIKAFQS